MTAVSEKKPRKSSKKVAPGAGPEVGAVQASEIAAAAVPAGGEDLPFSVTEAELDRAMAAAKPPVKSRQRKAPEATQPGDVAPAAAFPIPTFEPPILGMRDVPLSLILASELNPRKRFDKDAIRELAVSIFREGLQQNLVVRPHPERHGLFEIAAGERRWRAMSLLASTGLNAGTEDHPDWLNWEADHPVPVLVRVLTDLELLEVATSENVQRRRMTPLEEADAFAAMVDHGADINDVAARFGYNRRTVLRRVQVSRSLIQPIREKFDDGTLTLAQVEVLAAAGPVSQETVWGMIRGNPRDHTPAQLRTYLSQWTFLVKHRQFPPNWYKGRVVEDDLFGDIEPYFLDAAEAMECQLKHARALADKDLQKGAAFAQVWLSAGGRYHYTGEGTGVAYNVDKHTGKLERWEGLGQANPYYSGTPVYSVGDAKAQPEPRPAPASTSGPAAPTTGPSTAAAVVPAPAAEVPGLATSAGGEGSRPAAAAPATAPVAPVSKPFYGTHSLTDQVTLALAQTPRYAEAGFIYSCTYEGWDLVDTPAVRAAVKTAVSTCAPLLESVGLSDLTIASGPDGQYELRHVLPALLTLPDGVLTTLQVAYVAGCIRASLSLQGVAALSTVVPGAGFVLDEPYLKWCNHEALLELWSDAGLAPETYTTDEYLRSILLQEAPALAARGWLPRPLAADVELEVMQVEAQALIFTLTEDQARALLLALDPADDELGDAEDYPGMLLDEVQRMSQDELREWTALWQYRAAD